MERARATWTDERLDDLAGRMDAGFKRVDEELRALRTELSARIDAQGTELSARIDTQGTELGARIDAQGAELGARIDAQGSSLGARIDALQRTMIQLCGGIIAANLAVIVTVLAA
jgi:hypothetical protein